MNSHVFPPKVTGSLLVDVIYLRVSLQTHGWCWSDIIYAGISLGVRRSNVELSINEMP